MNNKSHIVIIYTIEKRPCKSLITQLTNTQRQGGKPIKSSRLPDVRNLIGCGIVEICKGRSRLHSSDQGQCSLYVFLILALSLSIHQSKNCHHRNITIFGYIKSRLYVTRGSLRIFLRNTMLIDPGYMITFKLMNRK